jgi:polar amino acid transport system substrate-binding protein
MALTDLETGDLGAFMKLEPVMRWLTKDRPRLAVVATGITTEYLAVAVAPGDEELARQIDDAQRAIAARGEVAAWSQRWFAHADVATTAVLL